MIERFVKQEKAIRHVLGADKRCMHLISTWQDVDVLELVSKALDPRLEFTDAFSGEQLVTVSYLNPVWHCSSQMSWQLSLMTQT